MRVRFWAIAASQAWGWALARPRQRIRRKLYDRFQVPKIFST